MTTQSLALTFQSTAFSVIDRNGEPWLKASELAQALGYKKVDAVTQIYDRNKDEFTDRMTQTLNLRVAENKDLGNSDAIRIFSLRGAHLVAMFARTAVAKDFRVWVLDIIDQHLGQQQAETLLPSEQQILQEIVANKVSSLPGDLQGKAIKEAWSRLHNKFRIAQYSQLPRTQLTEAIVYLTTMEIRCIPKPHQYAIEYITGEQYYQLKHLVWTIGNCFHMEGGGTWAAWGVIRKEYGCQGATRIPADQFEVVHQRLQDIYNLSTAFRMLMIEFERRFFRKHFGELPDEEQLKTLGVF
ncbi:MAG: ORF6C domain-containing protein [Gammaproteobacteria bacterium]|nr:ORF6C domain-containing protein [Gammaproteobacteria bacterium]